MNLIKVRDNEFVLEYGYDKYMKIYGLKDLFKIFQGIDAPLIELERALHEMIRNDHNLANFGVLDKGLVYTDKIETGLT